MTDLRISEAGTVQFPMVKHAAKIGWIPLTPDVAKQKRGGDAGMLLRDELEAKLSEFNQWLSADALRSIIETLDAIPATVDGNREMLMWLRGERGWYDEAEKRHRLVQLIDFEQPHANEFHVSWEWALKPPARKGNRADVMFCVNGVPAAIVERTDFLRTLQHWILFYVRDNETRKSILRQHQRRAIDAIVARCADATKTRGLVWHTQGSGKTFTLLTAAKLVLEQKDRFQNGTVILVVDRTELEGQLKGWSARWAGPLTKSVTFDVKTLEALRLEKGSDEGKVFNLVRGLQREIDGDADAAPVLQPLKDRAERILKDLENRNTTGLGPVDIQRKATAAAARCNMAI